MNLLLNNTKNKTAFFIRVVAIFLFSIFINYSFAPQYAHLFDVQISLNETTEEKEGKEEKEEFEVSSFKPIVNNLISLKFLQSVLIEQIFSEFYSKVLTPPPELK